MRGFHIRLRVRDYNGDDWGYRGWGHRQGWGHHDGWGDSDGWDADDDRGGWGCDD
ncbi:MULTISPECIES: hypothetical protein [unclassified Streptomyces]|uniref:hypothetical protein n=1 Tax=unclassified Streptomyces TaxID=2593676 RepID=UPI003D9065EB